VLSLVEPVDRVDGARRRAGDEEDERPSQRTTAYDDLLDLDRGRDERDQKASKGATGGRKKVPLEPERDLLGFLAEHTPHLEAWQRDALTIVRQERLYYAPQMRTKVLNEGWASLWHSRILRELDLPSDEYTEFAKLHSSVAAPSRRNLNPYYVGMKLLEHIERRWETPSQEDRDRMGLKGGEGNQKLFEVRELESDLSLIRSYLTKDAVEELDLYLYEHVEGEWKIVDKNWENVREQICKSMTTYGIPYIVVEDGDYRRNRELYLKHCFDGDELDLKYAERTLRYVQQIWDRTVHLETVLDGKSSLLSFDGERSTRTAL
jgi:stage V sporulation protein R